MRAPIRARTARAAGAALLPLALLASAAGPALADESVPPISSPASADASTRPVLFEKASSEKGLLVSIDSLAPKILSSDGELVVSGTVKNTGFETLTNPAALLSIGNETPVSIQALENELSEEVPPGPTALATNLGNDLAPGAVARFELRVPASQIPLGDSSEWGPRVVSVGVFSDGASGRDRSILLWDSGAEFSPTRVGALVPWTSENSTGDEAERAAVRTIAAIPGATLAMDSRVLESAPAKNKKPDEKAQSAPARPDLALASSLLSTGREVVALPTGDADLGALLLGGSTGLVEKAESSISSFPSSALALRTVSSDAGAEGAQSAQTGAEGPPVSGAQSSSRDAAPPGGEASIIRDVVWPSAGTFGTSVLAAEKDRVTIAPPGALTPVDEVDFTSLAVVEVDPGTGATSTSGAQDGTATVLAQNALVGELLDWRASSRADELDAEQALAAVTAIITRERPNSSRTLFATSSRRTVPTAGLSARLSALLSPRWVEGVPFSSLASSEATDLERASVGPGALAEDSDRALAALTDALEAAAPLASATASPKKVLASIEEGILLAISAAASPDVQLTRASQFSAKVSGLRSSITTEPSTAVNLINKTAAFPVRIRNGLPWDVDVVVGLVPSDPRLRVPSTTPATLGSGAVTTVEVPVEAIGSGDIEVTYKVSTPDGSVLEQSRTVLVRMRAGWEDAITITAAGLFALLFVGGLVRTVRKRLRHRREADGE